MADESQVPSKPGDPNAARPAANPLHKPPGPAAARKAPPVLGTGALAGGRTPDRAGPAEDATDEQFAAPDAEGRPGDEAEDRGRTPQRDRTPAPRGLPLDIVNNFDAEAAVRERYPERVGEVVASVEVREKTDKDDPDEELDPGDPLNLVVTFKDAQGRFLASEPYRRPGSARTGNG